MNHKFELAAQPGGLPKRTDWAYKYAGRWDFFGNPSDFKATPAGIPFLAGTSNPTCLAKAVSVDGGNAAGPTSASLATYGCYANGNSVMIPPAVGTFGTMRRNMFRGPSLSNWDFSIVKSTRLGERVNFQFRAEFFNVLNHPHFANPAASTLLFEDPSGSNFGCACATPDVGAANPVIGTGGPRNIQLGLKFIF